MVVRFVRGFNKVAALTPGMRKKLYKGLEYGGLGTLAAVDAHEMYRGIKEKDKGKAVKGALGAGALGALIGATKLSHG